MIGTHTHVPTADARILPKGTAFMTDVGMTGVINSSVGVKIETPRCRMAGDLISGRLEPAEGIADLCAVLIDLDPSSGMAQRIIPVRT
ncbi:YmdB family metallophosphoesterase, partial [Staphylococcus aureus]